MGNLFSTTNNQPQPIPEYPLNKPLTDMSTQVLRIHLRTIKLQIETICLQNCYTQDVTDENILKLDKLNKLYEKVSLEIDRRKLQTTELELETPKPISKNSYKPSTTLVQNDSVDSHFMPAKTDMNSLASNSQNSSVIQKARKNSMTDVNNIGLEAFQVSASSAFEKRDNSMAHRSKSKHPPP